MNPETENPIDLSIAPESASSHASANLDAAALTPDLALASIADRDLSSEVLEQISKNTAAMKSRKVRLALAAHPRAPRRIALRLVRELYTFDLMQFSLLPVVAADLKRVADELLSRLEPFNFTPEVVLDLGAGTGRMTGELKRRPARSPDYEQGL